MQVYRFINANDYHDKFWTANFGGDYAALGRDVFDVTRPLTTGIAFEDEHRNRLIKRVFLTNHKPPSASNVPPDIIMNNRSPMWLSQAARDVIERVEPHVHDFIAFEAIQCGRDETNGGVSRGTYYCLHLSVSIDCIDYEQTRWRKGAGIEAARLSRLETEAGQPVMLKSIATAGLHVYDANKPPVLFKPDRQVELKRHHLWRGAGHSDRAKLFEQPDSGHQTFMSGELYDAIVDAGLTTHWAVEECGVQAVSREQAYQN